MKRDRYRTDSSILVYVSLLHILWGIALLGYPGELDTASLGPLIVSSGRSVAGLILFLVGTGGLCSVVLFHRSWYSMFLAIPQQYLLASTLIGTIRCVLSGTYADGTVKTPMFILIDQLPSIIMTVWHAVVVTYMWMDRNIYREKKL